MLSAAQTTPCDVWRTLHQSHPLCDAPGSSSPYAVDLHKLLGPQCSAAAAATACCFQPLGYDDGPAFGTSFEEACGPRISAEDAYCQKSDGSKYGNCFCGPISNNASRLAIRGINYGGRFVA